jgi:hypothetical protein
VCEEAGDGLGVKAHGAELTDGFVGCRQHDHVAAGVVLCRGGGVQGGGLAEPGRRCQHAYRGAVPAQRAHRVGLIVAQLSGFGRDRCPHDTRIHRPPRGCCQLVEVGEEVVLERAVLDGGPLGGTAPSRVGNQAHHKLGCQEPRRDIDDLLHREPPTRHRRDPFDHVGFTEPGLGRAQPSRGVDEGGEQDGIIQHR